MNNEIRELPMDELEAVSGGAKVLNTIASALCEVVGDLAPAVGAGAFSPGLPCGGALRIGPAAGAVITFGGGATTGRLVDFPATERIDHGLRERDRQ